MLPAGFLRLTSNFQPIPPQVFTGKEAAPDPAVVKLEELKSRMEEARALFRNKQTTQFIIVTIPTVMAVAESCRLAGSLKAEGVPVNTLVVNQARRCFSFLIHTA